MAEIPTDGPYKIVELINAQTDDVWPLALGLIYVGFVILAQLVKTNGSIRAKAGILLVMALGALSLIFGYFVRGALIHQVSELNKINESIRLGQSTNNQYLWSVGTTHWWVLGQVFCPLLGAILLVVLVLSCRQIRSAVVNGWAK